MDDLLSQWREKQYEIASKSKVLDDDQTAMRNCPNTVEFSHLPQTIQDKLIGGVDVSFGDGDSAIAVYVITRNYQVLYTDTLLYNISQPYVSSYLAFREIEPLQKLVERQKLNKPELTPEVILVDGNGILHDRKAGLATFVGVRTGIPTIGVGKTIYCTDGLSVDLVERGVATKLAEFVKYCKGLNCADASFGISDEHDTRTCVICNVGIDAGNVSDTDENEESYKERMNDNVRLCFNYCDGFVVPLKGKSGDILAAALVGHGGKIAGRGKKKQVGTKNAVYISVGHDVSLQQAVSLCTALSLARIPEPVRQADLIGRDIIKRKMKT